MKQQLLFLLYQRIVGFTRVKFSFTYFSTMSTHHTVGLFIDALSKTRIRSQPPSFCLERL